uniref:Uncharacterized protein n=1 Tax=Rhizophora mucronata TaxID=61149 RepID=A0A2P2PQ87_RHIMU
MELPISNKNLPSPQYQLFLQASWHGCTINTLMVQIPYQHEYFKQPSSCSIIQLG